MQETRSEPHSDGVSFAVNSPLRRFGQDALRYLPAKLVPTVAAFASILIFTRMFTPKAYGIYSLVISIVSPVVVVMTEWASQPLGRFFSEYERRGNLQAYRSALGTLLAIVGIAGCIVGIGLSVSLGHLWGLSMGLAAGFLLFIQNLYSLVLPIIPASLDPWSYRLLEIARSLLRLGFSLGLILLLGARPAFLVWGLALGLAVLLPLLFHKISTKIGGLHLSFHITPEIARFARYGMPMMFWFFSAQLLNVGDRYVLQAFRGSTEVGIYSANYNFITGVAGLLGAPITLAAFPIIMHMWAHNRRNNLRKTISTMTEWYLLLGIGLVGCTAVGAGTLLSLALGDAFREGHTVLLPILAGQILWQASILGHKGMELMERTYWMLALACVAAITNLVLNLIFVPTHGYLAAAYTTLLSYGLYTLLIWIFSKRFVPWDIPFKSIVLAMVIAGSAMGIAQVVKGGTMPTQALSRILVFSGLYIMGIGIMKRTLFQRVLRRRKNK